MVVFKYFFPLFLLHCHKPLIVSFQSPKVRESPRNLDSWTINISISWDQTSLRNMWGRRGIKGSWKQCNFVVFVLRGLSVPLMRWMMATHSSKYNALFLRVKKFRHVEIYQIPAQMKEIKHFYEQRFLHQFQGFYFTSIWMITQRTGENIYALFWEL